MNRSHLKNRIFAEGQGGANFQTAGPALGGIEDLKRRPNAEIEPKDIFEITSRRSKCMTLIMVSTWLMVMAACTQSVKEIRLTTTDPQFNMLIAGDASAFKDTLRTRIISHYQGQSDIDVINIRKLKQVHLSDYDVVLIMDTTLAWTGFNPSLKAFLENLTDTHKVVLFMTAGDPDWEFSFQDLDAITSASNIENEETVFSEIIKRIDRVVAGR